MSSTKKSGARDPRTERYEAMQNMMRNKTDLSAALPFSRENTQNAQRRRQEVAREVSFKLDDQKFENPREYAREQLREPPQPQPRESMRKTKEERPPKRAVKQNARHKQEKHTGGLTSDEVELRHSREVSRQRMESSYTDIMTTFEEQQKHLTSKPGWRNISTKDGEEPHDLMITKVNHTGQLMGSPDPWRLKPGVPQEVTQDLEKKPGLMDAKFSELMSSEEWLKGHSTEEMKLTMKNLVDRGKIAKPSMNKDSGKVQQHIQFDATDINEFEYKLNVAIETYTTRIKWLLQGSRRFFGLVKGVRVGVLIDTSDANCGFGRLSPFQDALTHLLDEQLSKKKGTFLMCFGTEPLTLWNNTMDINCRSVEEAKQWLDSLSPSGGSNVLKALKAIHRRKDIDSILLILGSTPDQSGDVLLDYLDQLGAGKNLPIQAVAYDCSNYITNGTLQKLAENSGGRYQCYSSSCEEQIYNGSDISLLLEEIQKAQDIINKIKDMRQGLLGTAIVSVMNEISSEVAKLPQSRFLPRPPGHDDPLRIEMPNFQPASSYDWLTKHGLKAKGLDLYQVLAPNAYSFKEEFIPVIRKTVQSQVHGAAMAQFQWHDGTMKNVHVDMTQLFEYQKQLGATVRIYEKRIDWLGTSSRKIFGTVTDSKVIILVDLSISNLNYLVHVQHSLRLLMEQQLANKEYFNIIGFGSTAQPFRPTVVKPTPENLQAAWKFVLDMQCSGSRNFIDALRIAVENDEESKHNIEVEGIYLFTSGIPDQQADVCCSYVEEACAGRKLKLHVVLFNVDDYDAHGAIPSRYANITKTAECLRNLAHCSSGRFHWFRETGIIESDDIAGINLEIEKALNFSKKCSMLVENVKKKYNLVNTHKTNDRDMKMLPPCETHLALPSTEEIRALPVPKHTALTQARMEKAEVTELSKTLFRPSSASSSKADSPNGRHGRPFSSGPMGRVKGKKVQKAFFYTDDKTQVERRLDRPTIHKGSVFRKYPGQKFKNQPLKAHSIPDKEEQLTTKEWLRKYSLTRLKLNLNKIVTGPETRQTTKPVKVLNKAVEAKVFCSFPTINVGGTVQYLHLQPRELLEYEKQVERVLHCYLKRLQWLLSGSRRIFSTVVEKSCVFLIDTSGSMDPHMDELKRELSSLIWDQLYKHKVRFNLIQFSQQCVQWQEASVEASEQMCHDAIKWVSQLTSSGNTCTLEALELAFEHTDVEAVYLLTDGKPDTSTSLVQKEVANMNNTRNIVVNTISFNCEDMTANNFLKMLAEQTNGRYHRCHTDFDAHKFAHKLLSEGFEDHEYPPMPSFEGDDLKKLGAEITTARRFLSQSKSYRAIQENHHKQNGHTEDISNGVTVGPGKNRPISAKV